ncbi:MAG: hypothetical protein ABFC67_13555 [Mizugakiibacter sp.]|uniref:hypothetical protein n=1 Tax=Mizugakiibacter sp. TaxID=1972610 RepID=UPI0031BCAA43|nr:hypothetical protein [Xanthomonadaceae bacterium]
MEIDNNGEPLIIRNEVDAWAALEAAVSGGLRFDVTRVRFEGWPTWSLDAQGRDWYSTVPTRIMPPLLDVQKDINRAFASVQYGDPNLRRLREDDRESLEVVVKVEKGSSIFTADLSGQLNKIVQAALERMNGTEAVITALGIGLMITAAVTYKAWLANRLKEKELQSHTELESKNIESRIHLSQEETRRLAIMRDAMVREPTLQTVNEDTQATTNRLLKVTRPGDTIAMRGVPMTAEEAHEIAQPEREQAKELEMQGDFRIIGNRTDKGAGFRITVQRASDGLQFAADVLAELAWGDKQAIQRAEWSKSLVMLTIEAEMLRDRITRAVVISAKPVEVTQGDH